MDQTIGIFKRRFKILQEDSLFPIGVQARLVAALSALHNFIRFYDPSDGIYVSEEELGTLLVKWSGDYVYDRTCMKSKGEEVARAAERREEITQLLWQQHNVFRQHRKTRRIRRFK